MDKVKFKKKWENYWYYYKIHTIVAVFAVIVLAVMIQQCATRVDPDVTFVIATQKPVLTSDQQTAMQDYLQKYTADVNKDGKKVVQCEFINFSDSTSAQAEQVKLTTDLTAETDIIYIFDDDTVKPMFQDGQEGGFVKIDEIVPGLNLTDAYKLPLENTKLADQSFGKSLSGLGIYFRTYSKTNTKAAYVANVNNLLSIVKKLVKS